jgi:hypothetical protein
MIDHNLISIKTPEQIAMMREAGKICAQILSELTEHVKPGVTSQQINDIAYDLIVNKYGSPRCGPRLPSWACRSTFIRVSRLPGHRSGAYSSATPRKPSNG